MNTVPVGEETCSNTLVMEEETCDGRSLLEVVGTCNSTVVVEMRMVEEETCNDKDARADCNGRLELEAVEGTCNSRLETVEAETYNGTLGMKNTAMVEEETCSNMLAMEVVGICKSILE